MMGSSNSYNNNYYYYYLLSEVLVAEVQVWHEGFGDVLISRTWERQSSIQVKHQWAQREVLGKHQADHWQGNDRGGGRGGVGNSVIYHIVHVCHGQGKGKIKWRW